MDADKILVDNLREALAASQRAATVHNRRATSKGVITD